MALQLRHVFETDGCSADIGLTVGRDEFSDTFAGKQLISDVSISGSVHNCAGVVEIKYRLCARLKHICDRCAEEFEREYSFEIVHTLVTGFSNEDDESYSAYDDYIVCPDFTLDISDLVISDLTLMLPTKTLCSDDCEGLDYNEE